ncbi:hypothetical protein BH11ACT5_BH11ACT5_13150 [soil metagenome]
MAEAGAMVVTYEGLPLGSGGSHGLGKIGSRDAYRRTVDFITHCAVVVGPRTQSFTLHEVPGLAERPEWAGVLHREFGEGTANVIPVSDDRVEAALGFLEDIAPQPHNQWGMAPLTFTTFWKIAIVDPVSGRPFAAQDPARYPGLGYDSRVKLHLSNRASLNIEICIPDLDDQSLRALIPTLQSHAPFTFSAKQWRRWTASKTGSFTSRKIDVS